MKTRTKWLAIGTILLSAAGVVVAGRARAQQAQIPTLQVCNKTEVVGEGEVTIPARADLAHSGSFKIKVKLGCDPESGYPAGDVAIHSISMSDSIVQGTLVATALEQVTTTGKHTPTVYLNGRCNVDGHVEGNVKGCRFWLMIADNGRPQWPIARGAGPDIVSFLAFDGQGNRIAYGTGVLRGDVSIASTSH